MVQYDILIQNNANRQIYLLSGETNLSIDGRYLQFDDVDLPDEAVDGEYTYAIIVNNRDDVVYEYGSLVMDTILHTDDGDVALRDLAPLVGLMRVGKIAGKNEYDKKDNKIYYYER